MPLTYRQGWPHQADQYSATTGRACPSVRSRPGDSRSNYGDGSPVHQDGEGAVGLAAVAVVRGDGQGHRSLPVVPEKFRESRLKVSQPGSEVRLRACVDGVCPKCLPSVSPKVFSGKV